MARRSYIEVTLKVDENGLQTPLSLLFRGRVIEIDRVLDRRQACATKAGGQGLRYHVRIGQQERYLFQDDERRWFVEEDEGHVR